MTQNRYLHNFSIIFRRMNTIGLFPNLFIPPVTALISNRRKSMIRPGQQLLITITVLINELNVRRMKNR